jgi:hypothetical protein
MAMMRYIRVEGTINGLRNEEIVKKGERFRKDMLHFEVKVPSNTADKQKTFLKQQR